MTFRDWRLLGIAPVILLAAWCAVAHLLLSGRLATWGTLVWAGGAAIMIGQLALSWFQRPYTTTPDQDARLARLKVAIVIPCYNEDPPILDRALFAISQQTRLPQHVIVVDDGSDPVRCDYTEVRAWWECHMPCEFTWIRQANAGKKHAQAAAWRHVRDAAIYATIDSDSALEARALEEGLKPFADDDVTGVAGLELAWNYARNLLTRSVSARSLMFQLYAMSSQSVAHGNVQICPGAFSLYRGWLIHHVERAYLEETFLGQRVTLGDDGALTLFALVHGKAVHQPTACALNVYPESLGHHLRQWLRWMRASAIRTLWRWRYLDVRSYAWWVTTWQQWAFLTSVAVTIAVPLGWPGTEYLAAAIGLMMIASPLALGTRLLLVKRSDQRPLAKLGSAALLPFTALWFLLVLRQVKFYGMATCYKQGWVTRKEVEVFAETSRQEVSV